MRFFVLIFLLSSIGFGQDMLPLETVFQKGHKDYIRAYDFSPDNNFVISGGFDNILILWNLKSGKQIRTFSGHTERIRSIEFSPDQKYVLSSAADNKVKVFEILTGKLFREFAIENREIYNVYYSVNGKYVYGLDNRDGVHVWDVVKNKKLGTFKKEFAAHNERFIIDPLETKILSAGNYSQMYILDLQKQDTIQTIAFDKSYSQSFSEDGKYIAISSQKLFTSVYDSETGDLINTYREGEEKCDGCNTRHVFNPNGKSLLTMSSKVDAILWDIRSGKKIRSFSTERNSPNQLLFSSRGTYILISFDEEVVVYNTKTAKEQLRLKNDKIDYFNFKFSADEQFIILPGDNGELEVWNVKTGKKVKTIFGYLNQPDNSKLNLSYTNWTNQAILNYIEHKRKVALSPDNKSILIGGIDTTAMLIDLASGKIKKTLIGHTKSVIAFDFSPDGKMIATGGGDRLIKLWSTSTGKEIKTLKGHQETIFDLKFSNDGSHLISASWDGSLLIWNLNSESADRIEFGNNSPYTIGFTPNELYIVTGDLEKNVQFWERDAKKPFRNLIGHTSIPSAFDFSPDAKSIVTASWDGKVKLWDMLTGMLIGKMDKHQGAVYAIAYDPNGRFIASGGSDNQIILWDPKKNQIRGKLLGDSTAITSIEITTDGSKLISMSIDGVIKIWDLVSNQEIYSFVQMTRTDWLATNPLGYFDGSSKALQWVNYVKGTEVININRLFEKYFTPGLIQRISNGDKFSENEKLNQEQMTKIPLIALGLGVEGGKRSVRVNADSVIHFNEAIIPLEIIIEAHEIPLQDLRIYNNGKLLLQESLEENISFRGIGKNKKNVEISLVNGLNKITAVVVNEDRTESEPTIVNVQFNGEKAKTDLFLLSIGINNYKNTNYNLDYAVNDAKAFSKSVKNGTDSLFNSVINYSINNSNATKENILNTIAEIKEEIGSEDVFLFYYAGHGVIGEGQEKNENEFFIVTHDITNLYGDQTQLNEKAISATEIMEISIGVIAEKQLFILDACHSGGALDAFATRGGQREKALAQLARNTGTFFLTASQDVQYANEVGKLNHGLFTYALLEILEGKIDSGNDASVTVSELKRYVEERVPELSQEYHGSPQYPTGYSFGRDFPIVILK